MRHDGPSQESFFCVQRPILPGVTSQLSPAFAHAATGLCRDPAEPELVGQPAPKIVLGKGSGIDSIKAALKNIGVQATDEEAMQVVMGVKEFSLEHKRLLTDAEFSSVVAKVLPNKVGAHAVPTAV